MDHKKEEIPMKKLFAMLLALSMMLSCTALAAPEGKAAQTTAQLYINPQLLQGAPEQVMTLWTPSIRLFSPPPRAKTT